MRPRRARLGCGTPMFDFVTPLTSRFNEAEARTPRMPPPCNPLAIPGDLATLSSGAIAADETGPILVAVVFTMSKSLAISTIKPISSGSGFRAPQRRSKAGGRTKTRPTGLLRR